MIGRLIRFHCVHFDRVFSCLLKIAIITFFRFLGVSTSKGLLFADGLIYLPQRFTTCDFSNTEQDFAHTLYTLSVSE
jgi:hypothetical protein